MQQPAVVEFPFGVALDHGPFELELHDREAPFCIRAIISFSRSPVPLGEEAVGRHVGVDRPNQVLPGLQGDAGALLQRRLLDVEATHVEGIRANENLSIPDTSVRGVSAKRGLPTPVPSPWVARQTMTFTVPSRRS